MKPYTHIIWDWNGTLLDDAGWCARIVNAMLSKRSLKLLDGLDEYRRVFGFPVKNYYQKAGFDFSRETFEELSVEFIQLYYGADTENCRIHTGADDLLKQLSKLRLTQVILSASEKTHLAGQVSSYNMAGYFNEIIGLSDTYAKSKIEAGSDYISGKNIKNAVIIGDTLHDLEVSKALGIDCILIANGHQSKDRLLASKAMVLDDISEVLAIVSAY